MMKINPKIRLCRYEDLESIGKYMPPITQHQKRFDQQQNGSSSYLIAWYEGKPVGHLLVKWSGNNSDRVSRLTNGAPELNALAVVTHFQSKGIGSSLIGVAESIAKDKVKKIIGIGIEIDNQRAKKLYQRLGYYDWGYGTYIDEWDEYIDGELVRHQDECEYLIKEL